MKKTLALIIALLMVVTCFVSCGKKDEDDNNAPVVSTPVTNTSNASGDSSVADSSDSSADSTVADSTVADSSVVDSSVEDSSVADANSIVGSWEGDMNVAEMYLLVFEALGAGELFEDLTLDPVNLTFVYDFKADGTVESYTKNTDGLASGLENTLNAIATHMEEKTAGTEDAVTKDDVIGLMLSDSSYEEMAASMTSSSTGTYTVEGDVVTVTSEVDGEEVEEEFTISDNKLLISYDGFEVELTKK